MSKSLKLISWNVNGIRSVMQKGFGEFVKEHLPDVLCIQETKAQPEQVELVLDGYQQIWNSAVRKGYSGTAVFTRVKPIKHWFGLSDLTDDEGRVITVEFEKYYLVTVYTPNSKRGLERLGYRQQEWDPAFKRHLLGLEKTKPVVFCGDLNVAHTEIDLANPKTNLKNAGFTQEERSGFDNIVKAGFVDTFRLFESNSGHYTWWTWRNDARARNIGWRIDYFGASKMLSKKIEASKILSHVHGSDHCPVSLDFSP